MKIFYSTVSGRMRRIALALKQRRPGQAMTEVVLLFPVFLVILYITVRIFALLVMVQKLEIASFYAARRWQLESHDSYVYAASDQALMSDIKAKVNNFMGYTGKGKKFFSFGKEISVNVEQTDVWQVITLTANIRPTRIPLLCIYPREQVCQKYGKACRNGYDVLCLDPNRPSTIGKNIEVTKYVPQRERPIAFQLRQ